MTSFRSEEAALTVPVGRCPRCQSPDPHMHPAVQFEGEVEICHDPWHRAGYRLGCSCEACKEMEAEVIQSPILSREDTLALAERHRERLAGIREVPEKNVVFNPGDLHAFAREGLVLLDHFVWYANNREES